MSTPAPRRPGTPVLLLAAGISLAAAGVAGAGLSGCAVNPVTGQREFVLMSEAQEIQMGQEADQDIVRSMGLYDDPELQRYVNDLGVRMARQSERPNLPWTVRVIDDPVVNAFALPGGYLYVTRGILTHFSSEAELAGVVGHEIGHVTARHGVQQMSRAGLTQLTLGVGTILAPELAGVAEAAGVGLGLLFLRYGRDAERQADDLGIQYMTRENYDPREMAATFDMLARASGAQDGDRLPGFLSTHPDPLERRDRILGRIEAGEVSGTRVERDAYLRRLDGMTFGPNHREGFFRQGVFHHPDMAFRMTFPQGWRAVNQRTAVQAMNQEQDAVVLLTLADGTSATAARDGFARQEGLSTGNVRSQSVNGLPGAHLDFVAQGESGNLRGTASFIEHDGRVFRLLGYTVEARWGAREAALRQAVASFARETNQAMLNVQPARIQLVTLPEAMTLEGFHQRYPSSVEMEVVGTINRLRPGQPIAAGTVLKRVVGGELP